MVVALAVMLALGLALAGYETVVVLVVFLGLTVALAVWWVANREREEAPVHLFLLAMAGLALGIGVSVDLVTAQPDIDRMNTVFKFYLEAWVLFGVLAAVGLWYLAASGALSLRGLHAWPSRAWLGMLALLVLASSVFLILGTRDRLSDRFEALPLTLDGAAYQEVAVYRDPGPSNRATEPNAIYALSADAAARSSCARTSAGRPWSWRACRTAGAIGGRPGWPSTRACPWWWDGSGTRPSSDGPTTPTCASGFGT